MKKLEFIAALSEKLGVLDEADRLQTLSYYSEMINDRVEEGETEEEAVAALGDPEEIALRAISERPDLRESAGARETPAPAGAPSAPARPSRAGRIVAAATSVLWISLIAALLATVFALLIAGAAIAVAGFACIGVGVGRGTLLLVGTGFLLAGIGLALAALSGIFIRKSLGLTKRAFSYLFARRKEA